MAKLFFALCAFALFVTVAVAQPIDNLDDFDLEEDLSSEERETRYQMFIEAVGNVLAKHAPKDFDKKINTDCIYQLPALCGWEFVSAEFLECALTHFKQNKTHCYKQ